MTITPRFTRFSQFFAALIAAMALLTPSAGAWTTPLRETVVYAFHGSDGSAPYLIVEGTDGTLYGATSHGGAYGAGTVFALKPPVRGVGGWKLTVLASIPPGTPGRLAIEPNGAFFFYGAVPNGGNPGPWFGGYCDFFGQDFGCGSVFLVTPPAGGRGPWTTTTIYQFTGGNDGGEPNGIIEAGGSLFGVVGAGGIPECKFQSTCGGAFEMSPPAPGKTAWTEGMTIDFQFGPGGVPPQSSVLGAGPSSMFGVVYNEGWNEGFPPVELFVNPAGGGYAFDSSEGYPEGVVDDPNPNGIPYVWTSTSWLYAIPSSGIPTAIYHLPASGATVLLAYHGGVYGVYAPPGKRASIVALLPSARGNTAWSAHFLYTFTGGSDGAKPNSLLFAKCGDLYGTTYAGGIASNGVIFRLSR